MASFSPNPNISDVEYWFEKPANSKNFRIWHVMFFCLSAALIIVTLICCCIKIRIPRTKQEIEADYHRKHIAKKFQEKLKTIENQTMNNIDLKKALEIIHQEYEIECNTNLLLKIHDKPRIEVTTALSSPTCSLTKMTTTKNQEKIYKKVKS